MGKSPERTLLLVLVLEIRRKTEDENEDENEDETFQRIFHTGSERRAPDRGSVTRSRSAEKYALR